MKRVLIVGRPNVGKSTLFNALLRKRVAITHPSAGVTRDIISQHCSYKDHSFLLMDSGGLLGEQEYSDAVSRRGFKEIGQADVILFVISVEGLCAEDEHILQRLRSVSSRLILVINKVDNEQRSWVADEFYALGIAVLIQTSATHRRNIDALWDAILQKVQPHSAASSQPALPAEQAAASDAADAAMPPAAADEPPNPDTPVADAAMPPAAADAPAEPQSIASSHHETPEEQHTRICILGKPNSGKSSLFNYLLQSEQNLVSEIPGTTRDSVEAHFTFQNKPFVIVDSAGLRRKARVHDELEYFSVQRAIVAMESADSVLLLVDIMEGFTEQDKKICSVIFSRKKSCIICLSKCDLVADDIGKIEMAKKRIVFLSPQLSHVPLCGISVKTGKGIERLFEVIGRVEKESQSKISTAHINRLLQQCIKRSPPPIIKRRRGKLRFAAQSGTAPIRFELHVNARELFSESYRQYLINSIRKEYRLSNVPIYLELSEVESHKKK